MNTSHPIRFRSAVCGAAVVAALSVLSGCASDGKVGFAMGGTSAATPGGLNGANGANGAGGSGGNGADGSGAGGVVVGGTGGTGGTGTGTDGNPGTGGPGTGGPGTGGPVIRVGPGLTASNSIITNAGNTVSEVGKLVGGVNAGPASGLVENTGGAVDTLGQGVANGIGKMHQANAIGVTVDSVPVALGQLGDGVASVGAGTGLAPVTGTVGGVVNKTADLVGGVADNGAVRQVTSSASTLVRRVDDGLMSTTQKVGDATGLGAPVGGLTNTLGNGIAQLGGRLPGDRADGVTSALGTTVASIGGLVNAPAGATLPSPGGLGGGLVGGSTGTTGGGSGLGAVTAGLGLGAGAGVSAGPGGLTAGVGLGAVAGVTAPVTAVLSPVLAPVTTVLAPVTTVLAPVATPVVAPVVTAVAPVVGGVVNTTTTVVSSAGSTVGTVVGGTVGTVGGVAGGLIGGLGLGRR